MIIDSVIVEKNTLHSRDQGCHCAHLVPPKEKEYFQRWRCYKSFLGVVWGRCIISARVPAV